MSGSYKIQYFGVSKQYFSIRDEILNAYDEVLSSGQVIHGPKTRLLEEKIASMCDRKYAIAINNCSTALTLAMVALGVNGTSTMLCTAESYKATLNSIFSVGANPELLDTDLSGLMSMDSVTKSLVSKCHGLLYVNLYGNCIDYNKLLHIIRFFYSSEIPIIEDAAQSFGSTYKGIPSGKLGTVSCLSFDATKNMNNYGNGGMILTDDLSVKTKVEQLRSNGTEHEYSGWHNYGMNARMSELDAACILVKLAHFSEWQKRRTEIAEYYNTELCGLEKVEIPYLTPEVKSNWSKYVIRVLDCKRTDLRNNMYEKGIETKLHYQYTLYQHSQFAKVGSGYYYSDYQNTTAYKNSITKLSLPIYPELLDSEVELIVKTIKEL